MSVAVISATFGAGGRPVCWAWKHELVSALRVIAAAVVRENRLLLVSKLAAPEVYYLPGGKPDIGESPEACLRRELREELDIAPRAIRHFAEVHGPAALEPARMHMTVYRAEVDGSPRAAAEIASVVWWPTATPIRLAATVRDDVVPGLRTSGALMYP